MTKRKNKKINRKVITRTNVALLAVLVLGYLGQLALTNHASNQRYQISQYLSQFGELQTETQRLSVQAAELQSSERLSSESARINLVKADSIHYIAGTSAVALNN